MTKIIAAGGVLFRKKDLDTEVLLIKRNGSWDIPKGKLEVGESIPACAVREVSEELGIPMPMIAQSLGFTEHSYSLEGSKVYKTTYWYLMYSDASQFDLQAIEGITDYQWLNIQKAKSKVAFENLKIVLERVTSTLALL